MSKTAQQVILVSEDGQQFEVESAILARKSVFFSDLLALPQPTVGISAEPSEVDEVDERHTDSDNRRGRKLAAASATSRRRDHKRRREDDELEVFELDVPAKDLSMFLDLLHFGQFGQADRAWHIQFPMNHIRILLPVVDKFDCPDMKAMLRRELVRVAPKDPWGVLEIASTQNDVVLGRTAIRELRLEHIAPAGPRVEGRSSRQRAPSHRRGQTEPRSSATAVTQSASYLHNAIAPLQTSWQLELLKLLWAELLLFGDWAVCLLNTNMGDVASRFDPRG